MHLFFSSKFVIPDIPAAAHQPSSDAQKCRVRKHEKVTKRQAKGVLFDDSTRRTERKEKSNFKLPKKKKTHHRPIIQSSWHRIHASLCTHFHISTSLPHPTHNFLSNLFKNLLTPFSTRSTRCSNFPGPGAPGPGCPGAL